TVAPSLRTGDRPPPHGVTNAHILDAEPSRVLRFEHLGDLADQVEIEPAPGEEIGELLPALIGVVLAPEALPALAAVLQRGFAEVVALHEVVEGGVDGLRGDAALAEVGADALRAVAAPVEAALRVGAGIVGVVEVAELAHPGDGLFGDVLGEALARELPHH